MKRGSADPVAAVVLATAAAADDDDADQGKEQRGPLGFASKAWHDVGAPGDSGVPRINMRGAWGAPSLGGPPVLKHSTDIAAASSSSTGCCPTPLLSTHSCR